MSPAIRSQRLEPYGAADDKTLAFNARLAAILEKAPAVTEVPVDLMRRLRAEGKGVAPIAGPLEAAEDLEFDAASYGAPGGPGLVRRLSPDASPRGIFLHIHGGGWTLGSPDLEDGRNLRIAQAAGVEVLSVKYRLAPEHPWPACADDCLAAVRFAIERADAMGGVPILIGGASAGGHLAATTLQRLRPLGLFERVAGAVLIYGMYDLTMTPSAAAWGDRLMILSTPVIDWFVGNLLPDRSLAGTSAVSPLRADWRGAPPAQFQIGTEDPLLDDTLFMAERWRAAGAAAELAVFPGAVHAFDMFDLPENNLPIALQSQDMTAEFIDRRLKALGA